MLLCIGVRLALADTVRHGLEDATFVDDEANACMMTLYRLLERVKVFFKCKTYCSVHSYVEEGIGYD